MIARKNLNYLLAAVLFIAAVVHGQPAATVTIQANQPGAVVSSNLFGIFFEEINYAGEGGIYAEMVRNRAFYSPTNALVTGRSSRRARPRARWRWIHPAAEHQHA